MARRMYHHSAAIVRSQRRKLVWLTNIQSQVTITSGSHLGLVDLTSAFRSAGASTIGTTIMRTHGVIEVSYNTADTGPSITVGYLVTTNTASAGIDPNAQLEDDWMLWKFLPPPLSPSGIIIGTSLLCAYEIDLRAKRKMHEMGQQYLFCVFNGGSMSVTISAAHRVLLAMP